jgi:ribosome biogenesis GTPase A
MLRTTKIVRDSLKFANAIIEVRDARVPRSSAPKATGELSFSKPRLVLLNKTDLATKRGTKEWLEKLGEDGFAAIGLNSTDRRERDGVMQILERFRADILRRKTGLTRVLLKVVVVGIPNVGKSRLINLLTKRNAAPVAPRPGHTRGPKWITAGEGLEILDTPGLLAPERMGHESLRHLGLVGTLPEAVVNSAELAEEIAKLFKDRGGHIMEWEKCPLVEKLKTAVADGARDVLATLASLNGFLSSSREPDSARVSSLLVRNFREGKLGRFTIESPFEKSKSEKPESGQEKLFSEDGAKR